MPVRTKKKAPCRLLDCRSDVTSRTIRNFGKVPASNSRTATQAWGENTGSGGIECAGCNDHGNWPIPFAHFAANFGPSPWVTTKKPAARITGRRADRRRP